MTVAIAVRTRTHIAFATDSRVTDSATGAIVSDSARKYAKTNDRAAVFAGDWADCQAAMSSLKTPEQPIRAKNWESLAYDRQTDRLLSVSGDGSTNEIRDFAAIGSGGDVAYGYLAAAFAERIPRDVTQVKRIVRRALRAACSRSSTCGGRLRVFAVERT